MNFFTQNIKKLFLYGVNGVINTGVTYGLFLFVSRFVDYRISILLSYSVGIFLSFFLNSKFVFKNKGRFHIFILINIIMLLLNLTITWFLVENLGISKEYAQAIAIFFVFIVGFGLNRRFSFFSYSNS